MPEQELRESFEKLIQAAIRSGGSARKRRSRKRYAENAVVHDLGCNSAGQNHYLIAADVEGQRRNYRTVELPSADAQSDRPKSVHVAELLKYYLKESRSWTSTTLIEESEDDALAGGAITQDALLDRLVIAVELEKRALICDAESFKFSESQFDRLRPILWAYIIEHRDSKDSDELVAVGAAIRKYVSIRDIAHLSELATLLEAGHRAPLSPDLQLETAKMIFRKFAANPPAQPEPQPELSKHLWDIAQAYLNPHVLLHGKFATVASLCIEAVVAMRSRSSQAATTAALSTPYAWFGEMVGDNIRRLSERWKPKNAEAAEWCATLLQR